MTEALIAQLRADVRADGARFAVLSLTMQAQVTPDIHDPLARQPDFDAFYPETRIGQLCRSLNVPFLALAPPMQKSAFADGRLLHGFGDSLGRGHWNQAGHLLATEVAAPWLRTLVQP